jgi:hypothetical protein
MTCHVSRERERERERDRQGNEEEGDSKIKIIDKYSHKFVDNKCF